VVVSAQNRRSRTEGAELVVGEVKMHSIAIWLRHLWRLLREACGENDYARCCADARARGQELPTPEAYYLAKLHRKYSRPTRCC